MLRALRVLLAASLCIPAPAWAAGEVRSAGAAPIAAPSGPAVTAPALPSLPSSAIPALGSSLSAPRAAEAASAASVAAAPEAATAGPQGAAVPGASAGAPASQAAAAAVRAAGRAVSPKTRAAALNDNEPPAANDDHAPARTALKTLSAGSAAFQAVSPEVPDFGERAGELGERMFDNAAAHGEESVEPDAARGKGKGKGGSGGGSGSDGGGNGNGGSPGADDGGGDNYPSRQIRFHGKLFRAVLFRPNVPVEPEIIRAIDAAKSSVHLALYEFKLPGILEALRRARDRGVEIHIVLDYSNVYPQQEPGSTYRPRRSQEIWALLREGFDVRILRGLSKYGINHNKIAVIDHGEKETMAFFGSYNWSWSAEEHHYENANFTTEKRRTEALMAYWKWLDSLAQPESAARDYAWPSSVPAPPVTVAEDIHFNGISLPSVVLSPSRLAGKTVEDRLVQAIDAAETSIDMSAFAVRSTKIAEALVRAHKDPKRKVKVRVIFDESQAESEPFGLYAKYLAANGVEVRGLAGPNPNSDFPLAEKDHHKFTVFDGKLVETGSANMTKYASAANFENAHFLDNKTDVAGYAWVFDRMFKRAAPVEAPQVAPTLPTDAELEAEVTQAPPPAPQPEPHPGPADPSITPRDIPFNGKVFPSYAFRPDTPIQPIVVQALDAAKTSIRMAVYEFNLPDVLDALRRAKKRKLKIELVIDQSHVYTRGKDHTNQPRKPSAEILALINEGFDVLVLKGEKSGIMHNKYMVLDAEDGGMVEFGSYNFAKTAENNHYENIKFSNDAADVKDYLAYFNYKRGLASPIDHDKLDEVLNRGLAGDDDGEAAPEARGSGDPRDSKFPHPPVSTAPSITFNGETFHRHYFSPQGGILDAWVRAIRAAESSIDIAMFGFYSKEVAEAVIERMERAKQEGKELTVRLLLDAGQSSLAKIDGTPVGQWFAQRGAEVHMKAGPNPEGDPMFEKQHNKFMIIDGKLLFTGSFNLSPTAENNSFENENVVDDPADLRGYVEYFMRVFGLGWPPRGSKTAAGAASAAPHSFLGF